MVNRRGTSSMGCLTAVALLAALAYLGSQIGQPYFRYYQYRDAIVQEGRFAALRTDSAIKQNIWANADSLVLPEDAYHVKIKRTPRNINIRTEYEDSWTVYRYTRPVPFIIDVTSPL